MISNEGGNGDRSAERKGLLSALWVFVMFNYLYADVMGLMDPILLKQFLKGQVDSLPITQEFLFAAAILMEIPIAMTILSRVLKYRANRWANIVAGSLKTLVVLGSLFIGKVTLYYVFFSTIEMACTALIVGLAWKWAPPESLVREPRPDPMSYAPEPVR